MSSRRRDSAEITAGEAGRLPVPRRRRRGALRRQGEVAAFRAFAPTSRRRRTGVRRSRSLPARVADVEVIVTGSEVEALHLEQNLVKRHRPPFNVRLRDDKSFPYIAVTVEDEYPRVMFTRERHRPGRLVLRPVREREEGARDARRAQPRLPLPAVRRAEAGAAQRDPVPRLPHRPLPRAVRRATSRWTITARSSTE